MVEGGCVGGRWRVWPGLSGRWGRRADPAGPLAGGGGRQRWGEGEVVGQEGIGGRTDKVWAALGGGLGWRREVVVWDWVVGGAGAEEGE